MEDSIFENNSNDTESNSKNSVNNLNDSDGIINSKRQTKNNIKSEKLPKNDLFDDLEYFGKKEFLEEIIGVYEISIDTILICTQETVEKKCLLMIILMMIFILIIIIQTFIF